jgi:hypothetical protein
MIFHVKTEVGHGTNSKVLSQAFSELIPQDHSSGNFQTCNHKTHTFSLDENVSLTSFLSVE